MTYGN